MLVAEYRRLAERLGVCPMSRASIERALVAPCAEPPPRPGWHARFALGDAARRRRRGYALVERAGLFLAA